MTGRNTLSGLESEDESTEYDKVSFIKLRENSPESVFTGDAYKFLAKEPLIIHANTTTVFDTGLAMKIENDWEYYCNAPMELARSGVSVIPMEFSCKNNIVYSSFNGINAELFGPLKFHFVNLTSTSVEVSHGAPLGWLFPKLMLSCRMSCYKPKND